MAKRTEIKAEEAKKFLAKGKKRRSEIQHDADLETKHAEKVGNAPRRPAEGQTNSTVGAGALRGVVGETMARMYEEFWPTMTTRDRDGAPEIEIAEEAYILVNYLVVGHSDDKPRVATKIREAEISANARFCKEHSL